MSDVSPVFLLQALTSLAPMAQNATDRLRARLSPEGFAGLEATRNQFNREQSGYGGAFGYSAGGDPLSARQAQEELILSYLGSENRPTQQAADALVGLGRGSQAPEFQSVMPGGGSLDVGSVDLSGLEALESIAPYIAPQEERDMNYPTPYLIPEQPEPWGQRFRSGLEGAQSQLGDRIDTARDVRSELAGNLREAASEWRDRWRPERLEQWQDRWLGGPPQGDKKKEKPSYQTGTPYVPKTGQAQLHQGEAVIPAEQNPFNWNANVLAGSETGAAAPGVLPDSVAGSVNATVPYVQPNGLRTPTQPRDMGVGSGASTQVGANMPGIRSVNTNPVPQTAGYLQNAAGQAGDQGELIPQVLANPTGWTDQNRDLMYQRFKESLDPEYAAVERQMRQAAAGSGRLGAGNLQGQQQDLAMQRLRSLGNARRDIDINANQQSFDNLMRAGALEQQSLGRGFGELSQLTQLGEMLGQGQYGRDLGAGQFGYEQQMGNEQLRLGQSNQALQEELGRGQFGLSERGQTLQEELGHGQLGLAERGQTLQEQTGLGGLQLRENEFAANRYDTERQWGLDLLDKLTELGFLDQEQLFALTGGLSGTEGQLMNIAGAGTQTGGA